MQLVSVSTLRVSLLPCCRCACVLEVLLHLFGVREDLLEALLEAIDVVVYQVLPMDLALVDEADKGEALVNFAQVQHDVLLIVRVGQPDD